MRFAGAVLYSSILAWNASRVLAAWADRYGDAASSRDLRERAARIVAGANAKLWNASTGLFRASTGIARDNIDVWANAFAAASGFADANQSLHIFRFFKAHEKDIFYEGQVREIPKWQQWTQVCV